MTNHTSAKPESNLSNVQPGRVYGKRQYRQFPIPTIRTVRQPLSQGPCEPHSITPAGHAAAFSHSPVCGGVACAQPTAAVVSWDNMYMHTQASPLIAGFYIPHPVQPGSLNTCERHPLHRANVRTTNYHTWRVPYTPSGHCPCCRVSGTIPTIEPDTTWPIGISCKRGAHLPGLQQLPTTCANAHLQTLMTWAPSHDANTSSQQSNTTDSTNPIPTADHCCPAMTDTV